MCSLSECLYSKISASNAPRCGAERKRIVRQINSEVRQREIACNSARINKYRGENAELRRTERAATAVRERKRRADDPVFRNNERTATAAREKKRRVVNPEFRRNERAATAAREKKRRVVNPEFRRNERAATAAREKKRRVVNPEFRRNERAADAIRKTTRRAANSCKTVEQLINKFHDIVATCPVYVCSSCNQLLYKQAVQKAKSLCKLNGEKFRSVLLGKTSVDGIEWVCYTCNRYLRRGKMPPYAIANNLKFPEVPTHLPQLFTSELRMLSPRIAFIKFLKQQLVSN